MYKFDESVQRQYLPEECIICLMGYTQGDAMIDYPNCNHCFHFDCLSVWLKEKMVCPLCKGTIRSSIIRAIVNDKTAQDCNKHNKPESSPSRKVGDIQNQV